VSILARMVGMEISFILNITDEVFCLMPSIFSDITQCYVCSCLPTFREDGTDRLVRKREYPPTNILCVTSQKNKGHNYTAA